MIQQLYIHSDLNLIPVTLNALSTKSLKDYLLEIGKLHKRNLRIKFRIIKNEVYGKEDSKPVGKTATTNANRNFLNSLIRFQEDSRDKDECFLREKILLNLEIPDASIIRNAQDRGISALDIASYSVVRKAFEKLTDNIQYILNRETPSESKHAPSLFKNPEFNRFLLGMARAAIIAGVIFYSTDLWNRQIPAIKTPSQMEKTARQVIGHQFDSGESVYRFAKYAISLHRAYLPNSAEVNRYVMETIKIHNMTNPEEKRIYNFNYVPAGTEINFYPPECIQNDNYKYEAPVYEYFMSMVQTDYPYITGMWGKYGSGGDSPHSGIDVAAPSGSPIMAPVSGTIYNEQSSTGGNVTCVMSDDFVILFAHCGERFFNTGDPVKKGQIVGQVGLSGRTNGPHVHIGYGIRFPGSRLNDLSAYRFTDPKYLFFRQAYQYAVKNTNVANNPEYTTNMTF